MDNLDYTFYADDRADRCGRFVEWRI